MKVSRNQYDAACGLINYGTQNGDKVHVSTSEYSMDIVSKWCRERNERYAHANVATMRGFAKRGLIEWDQGWREGVALILDIDGLKELRENV
jgi:hypothetical protein